MSRREEQHVDEEGYRTPNLPSFLQMSCAQRGLPAARAGVSPTSSKGAVQCPKQAAVSSGPRKAVGVLAMSKKSKSAKEVEGGLIPVGSSIASSCWDRAAQLRQRAHCAGIQGCI